MPPLFFRLGLPYPPYALRILRRTVLMWLSLKLLLFVLFGAPQALLLPTLGIPALLVLIDRVKAKETLLVANLGVSEWWLGIATVALCLALDAFLLLIAPSGGAG